MSLLDFPIFFKISSYDTEKDEPCGSLHSGHMLGSCCISITILGISINNAIDNINVKITSAVDISL